MTDTKHKDAEVYFVYQDTVLRQYISNFQIKYENVTKRYEQER